jgi:hypothetical protein
LERRAEEPEKAASSSSFRLLMQLPSCRGVPSLRVMRVGREIEKRGRGKKALEKNSFVFRRRRRQCRRCCADAARETHRRLLPSSEPSLFPFLLPGCRNNKRGFIGSGKEGQRSSQRGPCGTRERAVEQTIKIFRSSSPIKKTPPPHSPPCPLRSPSRARPSSRPPIR